MRPNSRVELGQSRIDETDFSFLMAEFMQDGYSAQEFGVAIDGLKQFFSLALYDDGPLAVTSRVVDDLWHKFILFTPQYREFCISVFGYYLDHQTHTDRTPVPATAFPNFINAFESLFGASPGELWVRDLPSAVREAALQGRAPEELNFRWSGWPGRSKVTALP